MLHDWEISNRTGTAGCTSSWYCSRGGGVSVLIEADEHELAAGHAWSTCRVGVVHGYSFVPGTLRAGW